jgi:hypothetical protein
MSVDFRNFDPSRHGNDSEGGGVDPVPAGTYVLAVRNFKREVRNGKRQIDFIICAVLDDELNAIAGDAYAPIWEVVTLTDAAAFRIANLLNAIGAEPPINVMSDKELARAVRWRPFRASVTRRTYNERVKAQIDRYAPLSADARAAFDAIADDLALDFRVGRGGGGGGYDDRGGYDDDRSRGGGYDAPRQNGNGGGARRQSRFQDDDIPF